MNSRERVRRVLKHELPDRVPIDIGGTSASGINVYAYYKFKKKLGKKTDDIKIYDIFGMIAQVEMDIIETLGIDTILVHSLCPRFGIPTDQWKPWTLKDGEPVKIPVSFKTVEEDDGSLLLVVNDKAVGKMPAEGHYFSELANSAMGSIDSLTGPPDPDDLTFSLLEEEDLRFRQNIAKRLYETTDKALITDLNDNLRWDTSMSNWLFAIASAPEISYKLHKKKVLT